MRVLALNVKGFSAGVDRVAEVIRATDPDVALLNEAYRWPARRLASSTGRSLAFGATRPFRGLGNAVLFRSRPAHVRRLALSRTRGLEPRGALIAIAQDGVAFVSVHLGVSSVERERHALELIETLAAYEPVVLGGDMNERPHRGAVAILSTRFVDAFERAGEGSGETFPATAPLHRIDYVLCSHDLGPGKAAVVPIVASDHLAVAVDFRGRSDSGTS